MADDIERRLSALIDEVVRQLQVASQGSALCALSRSGQPVDAVKYYEGAWGALTELRRLLRTTPPTEAFATSLEEWRGDLAARRAAGTDGNWVAYRTGGIEHLTMLAEALGLTAPADPA